MIGSQSQECVLVAMRRPGPPPASVRPADRAGEAVLFGPGVADPTLPGGGPC